MRRDKVILIVLNWNKPLDTIECVDSCRRIDYDNFEIVIVDNHSADDSVRLFKERFPDLVVLCNEDNLGYAGGNNVGIRYALSRDADYILLLNNDVVVDRNVLKVLVQTAREFPEAGMLAPKVLFYDDRSAINSLGTRMDWLRLRPFVGEFNEKDEGQFERVQKKDILVGCALFITRRTIDRIGLIDERFFIFHEEADWCFRNLKSGSANLVAPQAVVYHKASKTMREFSALTHYYSIRNFLYLAYKNASPGHWLKTRAGLLFLMGKHLALALRMNEADRRMARAFFWGVWDYFGGHMGKCRRIL